MQCRLRDQIFLKNCFPYIPFYFEPILLNKKCSKVYMMNSNNKTPNSIQKWKTKLSSHLEINISTKESFKVCFKLNYLQIPTKYYLHKINVISDNICSFCEDLETIQHVFLYCPHWRI
jgi:hypothetical protein